MSQKKIGTHNGTFHCDEALACFLLHQTKEFAGAEIVRTRDEKVLEQLDVLVDVGGAYIPEKFRFDHHQIGFTATLDEKHPIKLSSAGLIYKHFGREIIRNRLGTDERITNLLFYKVYKDFIESIDAIDNGIDQYPKDLQPKYLIRTHLSARVGQLNPWWNDTQPNIEEKFKQAMQLAGSEFLESIDYYGKAWLPGRSIVEKAVSSRFEEDPSGEIIVLDQFCPWKDHLQDIETDFQVSPPIIYVLFQDFNKTWRVQCVPVKDGSFENRLPLLWKGLREEELSKASETEGGIFVHISGFIGGNKTKEGVLSMARKSLQQPRPQKV